MSPYEKIAVNSDSAKARERPNFLTQKREREDDLSKILQQYTFDDEDGMNTSAEANEMLSCYDYDKTWTFSDFPNITFNNTA